MTKADVAIEAAAKSKKEKEKRTFKEELLSWVYTLLAALVIVTVIRTFFFEPIRVDGESMRNTLQDGDIVLVTKPEYWSGNYQRGDVIICRYPNRNKESSISLGGSFELTFTNHTLFVKRLIGLPGDKIEFRQGVLYVNDQLVDESNIDVYIPYTRSMGPITLGRDQYFVVGDNRGNSNDSRAVGPISEDMIVGHVNLVVWPLSNFGKVE
ncbi:MAG: signal peptidase I [Clostridia bacterium]|nr:signal peptidase I [Clostridia bacterium]